MYIKNQNKTKKQTCWFNVYSTALQEFVHEVNYLCINDEELKTKGKLLIETQQAVEGRTFVENLTSCEVPLSPSAPRAIFLIFRVSAE